MLIGVYILAALEALGGLGVALLLYELRDGWGILHPIAVGTAAVMLLITGMLFRRRALARMLARWGLLLGCTGQVAFAVIMGMRISDQMDKPYLGDVLVIASLVLVAPALVLALVSFKGILYLGRPHVRQTFQR